MRNTLESQSNRYCKDHTVDMGLYVWQPAARKPCCLPRLPAGTRKRGCNRPSPPCSHATVGRAFPFLVFATLCPHNKRCCTTSNMSLASPFTCVSERMSATVQTVSCRHIAHAQSLAIKSIPAPGRTSTTTRLPKHVNSMPVS